MMHGSSTASFLVLQSLPVGSLVVQVKATDADVSPDFNTVYYSIEVRLGVIQDIRTMHLQIHVLMFSNIILSIHTATIRYI